jgi:hypothetical protein
MAAGPQRYHRAERGHLRAIPLGESNAAEKSGKPDPKIFLKLGNTGDQKDYSQVKA